jgi:hypothetical protein
MHSESRRGIIDSDWPSRPCAHRSGGKSGTRQNRGVGSVVGIPQRLPAFPAERPTVDGAHGYFDQCGLPLCNLLPQVVANTHARRGARSSISGAVSFLNRGKKSLESELCIQLICYLIYAILQQAGDLQAYNKSPDGYSLRGHC